VVIDKVVVHHTESTLIAVAVGLSMFLVFSAVMSWARQKDCNAKAKTEGKKGSERKQFMSTCLKGKASAPSQKR